MFDDFRYKKGIVCFILDCKKLPCLIFIYKLFYILSIRLINSENKMAAALSSSTNSEPNMIQADVVPASGKDEISAIQGFFFSFFIRFVSILIIIK